MDARKVLCSLGYIAEAGTSDVPPHLGSMAGDSQCPHHVPHKPSPTCFMSCNTCKELYDMEAMTGYCADVEDERKQ